MWSENYNSFPVIKMKVALLVVAFLPGFLSVPSFQSSLAYNIVPAEESFGNYETDKIISHAMVPLISNEIRVKRQISSFAVPPTTLPESTEKSLLNKQQTDTTKKAINPETKQAGLGVIWANKTRKIDPTSGAKESSGGGGRLLGSERTDFINQNETITSSENATIKKGNGTLVPLDEDYPYYPPVFPDLSYDGSLNNATYNNTRIQRDDFKYYEVNYTTNGSQYWVNMNESKITHDVLSNAHRRAATLKPKFEFPFYGNPISNMTVATGGFIYLGDQVHAWLAATQYVAPLMANFESSASDHDVVSYLSTDDFFTVEWKEVRLEDSPNKGNFTFQTTLYKNGTIVFAYKNIAIPIKEINDTNHPVKVGLSDAYIRDRGVFVIKQKTIYEYHRIDLKEHYEFELSNGSAIIFTPQETCHLYKSCKECTAANITFECSWCPKLNRCSDGMDRKRQEWTQNQCDKNHAQVQNSDECKNADFSYNINTSPSTHPTDDLHDDHHSGSEEENYKSSTSQVKKEKTQDAGTSSGGVLGILFMVIMVLASVGWLVYAYLYPHTPSGQLLIRYRPSQWGFRRGEARYTAASIHM